MKQRLSSSFLFLSLPKKSFHAHNQEQGFHAHSELPANLKSFHVEDGVMKEMIIDLPSFQFEPGMIQRLLRGQSFIRIDGKATNEEILGCIRIKTILWQSQLIAVRGVHTWTGR